MARISTEFKVGVLVVAGIAVLFMGINYLKGFNLLEEQRTLYAVYENIDGLVESNPVTLNGYKVGQVKEIKLAGDGSGKIIVVLTIFEKELRIPKDSKARVYSSDLLGSKAVELKLGEANEYTTASDTLVSETQATLSESVNKEVLPLKRKAEGLISSIDSMVNVVNTIFNENARKSLSKSFKSIEKALTSLENTSFRLDTMIVEEKQRIRKITSNLSSITGNLRGRNEEIGNTLDNLSMISDSLADADIATTINNAKGAIGGLEKIIAQVEQGEGSLGKLVKEDSLHNSLLQASKDLDLLLQDLRMHPERYVHYSLFGRKTKGLELSPKEERRLEKLLEREEKQKE